MLLTDRATATQDPTPRQRDSTSVEPSLVDCCIIPVVHGIRLEGGAKQGSHRRRNVRIPAHIYSATGNPFRRANVRQACFEDEYINR